LELENKSHNNHNDSTIDIYLIANDVEYLNRYIVLCCYKALMAICDQAVRCLGGSSLVVRLLLQL
jgi:hypothetical protein